MMRGICVSTYNRILDLRVLMPRASIDRLILVDPPTGAFEFNIFANIDFDEVIVYL